MKFANFYKLSLCQNDVFPNLLLRQILKIWQQNIQVILFNKVRKKTLILFRWENLLSKHHPAHHGTVF